MKDREIFEHIRNGINEAPIDMLDSIKSQKVVKMMKHDDITRQENKKSFKPLMYFASVAAAFLLVFFNVQLFIMADSQIYIDVNPGIEITTNKRDNVIKLQPINEDALEIIQAISYKNNSLKDVTEDILDSLIDKGYIKNEDEIMLVSVYNGDSSKSEKLTSQMNDTIHNKLDKVNKNPILLTQSLDKSNTVDEFAREYGISTGKMTFIRNMIIMNPDLKTEELVDLSLVDLIEISRNAGIDIEKILNTGDYDRLNKPINHNDKPFDDDNYEVDNDDYYDDDDDEKVKGQRIGEARAKEIALGLVNGKIVDFDLDYDEYEIEILANGYEYDIDIDAYTGEVLKFEKDEYDHDYEEDDDNDDDDDDDNDNDDDDDDNDDEHDD